MMENFDEKLENLLLNKTFSDLMPSEREYVLKALTEEEYTKCHFFMRAAGEALDPVNIDLVPNGHINEHLKTLFKPKYQTQSFFSVIFLSPPRRLAIALGSLCIVFTFFLIFYLKPNRQKIVQTSRITEEHKSRTYPLPKENHDFRPEKETVKRITEVRENMATAAYKKKAKGESPNTTKPLGDTDQMLCLTVSIDPLGMDLHLPQDLLNLGIAVDVPVLECSPDLKEQEP